MTTIAAQNPTTPRDNIKETHFSESSGPWTMTQTPGPKALNTRRDSGSRNDRGFLNSQSSVVLLCVCDMLLCVYLCISIPKHIRILSMYVYIYICVCVCVHTYVCMHMYIFVCIWVYMYLLIERGTINGHPSLLIIQTYTPHPRGSGS